MAASADPTLARASLARFLETCGAGVLEDPRARSLVVALFAASRPAADLLCRRPALVGRWLGEGLLRGPVELARDLGLALADSCAPLDALRRFHHEEVVRVLGADLVGGASLEAVTGVLSDVAEVITRAALELAWRAAGSTEDGAPGGGSPGGGLAVMALGKLGGRELNYSSDIDLLFVHADGIDPGGRELQERVARLCVAHLGRFTEEGRAYRVDTRLRPEGGAGALTRSIRSYADYYASYGSTWERQALIKARPLAGDARVGEGFLEAVRPFVFRRTLDATAVADIQSLRSRIEREAARRGLDDVKRGYGGIRDIEFTVQFLQLVVGGVHPEARSTGTLEALAALEAGGAFTRREAEVLREAYRFLRAVEHRLQNVQHAQVHTLPPGGPDLERLARQMGHADGKVFLAERARLAHEARAVLDRVLMGLPVESRGRPAPEAELALDPDPPPGQVERVLAPYGIDDPRRAWRVLSRMASDEAGGVVASGRIRTAFAGLAAPLLARVAETDDPHATLERLERVLSTLGARGVFYELMAENPDALRVLVRLATGGDLLTGVLERRPGLLDEVVDGLLTLGRPERGRLRRELEERLATGGDPVEVMADFHGVHLVLAGLRDLDGRANLRETMATLSEIADAIIEASTQRALDEVGLRRGRGPGRFAVFALGKLGGLELNYASDLDLIFVGESGEGPAAALGGYARVAQRVLRLLGGSTRLGALYRVDTRLRPEGNQGPLVVGDQALVAYFREGRAAPWERQAFTRARAVAGDGPFAEAVAARVEELIYGGGGRSGGGLPGGGLAAEVRAMRERLEQGVEGPDLKRGAGGIVDIEFTVQLLQLAHGADFPAIRRGSTFLALHHLAAAGLLAPGEYRDLLTAYQFLRQVEARLHLVHQRPQARLPLDDAELRRLARFAGYVDTADRSAQETFMEEYRWHVQRTRQVFEAVVTREGDG
ncbi:MAG: hypothetical protein HY722_08335 [Planctomycetes bacterium]|nr:hypothetical protein [Planctomycetota bacterium]